MANTLPSFGILSMEQFPALRQKAAQIARYSTNFTAEIATAGTSITVGYQSPVSASLWAGSYTSADEVIGSTTVTLKEPYYVEFYLSPNELVSYGETYLQNRMAVAALGVADEIRKQTLALFSGASVATVATLNQGSHNFNTILSGSTVLLNSGSQGEISFLAASTVYNGVLVDAKAAGYNIANTVTSGQEEFNYGPAVVTRENFLSSTISGSGAVVTTKDAAAIAVRLPNEMPMYQRTIFADEQTGLAIAVDLLPSETGKFLGRAHACAGVALGRPGAVAKYINAN